MFFGGVAGLNVFHPDDIKPNEVPPPVAITGLRLLNEQIIPGPNSPLEKQLLVTDEVELNHSDKMFTFEFVGLHYVDPSRNQYQYMLDGFNEDWVSAGTENTATFTNLDPGRYSFKVKSANSDGVWSDTYASIGVTIKPPWWQTTWAYLSYGLLLLCSVVVVDRVQRKRVETRATARMLAAENERKTNELEHAREVQLSLLPQVPPKVPGIEIAAGMRTATEVGGDYYDFNVAEDGALVIAIGDATGHGLSAGTVVSATKGIFSLVANESDIELAMDSCARGVRRLGLQKLFMAFALVRIADYCLEVVGGGMPPALVYRADTGTVEEISLSGLPLGSPRNGQYRKTAVPLKPGDTVLLMSDGFPELFNGGREMLGYDRARSELAKVGSSSADAVLQHFHSVCEEWTQNAVVGDDVTFVVLKVNYAS
jgi:serine phosphatase RsbU (regulator of sigma subunit)